MGVLAIDRRLAPERRKTATGPGFWTRLFRAAAESRRRAAERELDRLLQRNPHLARCVAAGRADSRVWKAAADALPF